MACPLGEWEGPVKGLMDDTGMSEEEAKREVASWMQLSQINDLELRLISGETEATTDERVAARRAKESLIFAIDTEGTDNTVKDAAARALVNKLTPNELLILKERGAIKNWDAIAQAAGYAEWTKGEHFNQIQALNDSNYLGRFIAEGNTEAISLFKVTPEMEKEIAWNNQHLSGMDEATAIRVARATAITETARLIDNFASKATSLEKTGQELAKSIYDSDQDIKLNYDKFYTDFRNIKKEAINVVEGGIYPKLEWNSGIGKKYDLELVYNEMLYNPTLKNEDGTYGNYDPNFKVVVKVKEGYDSATLSFDARKYGEMLKNGELTTTTVEDNATLQEALTKISTDFSNTELWTCTGTLCDKMGESGESDGLSMGGGGGGGGGGSGGYSKSYGNSGTEETTTGSLYIECNVEDAQVYSNGEVVGGVNTLIEMEKGTYTIEVRATGYVTRSTSVTIGNYAVSKTLNLTKKPPSISTFIKGIGGIQNLTKQHYLYLFCIYKMRSTSEYSWKQFADSVITITNDALPTMISKEDVMYIYHLVNGDVSSANALVEAGKVTLDEAEAMEIEGGE